MDIQFNLGTILFFLATFILIGNLVLFVLYFPLAKKRKQIIRTATCNTSLFVITVLLYLAVTPEETVLVLAGGVFAIQRVIIAFIAIISLLLSLAGTYLFALSEKKK